jgi:hypothetical protein
MFDHRAWPSGLGRLLRRAAWPEAARLRLLKPAELDSATLTADSNAKLFDKSGLRTTSAKVTLSN